ncbi:ABC transporter permease [Solitalea koreensis]|uniref:Putative ABC transport system permease protein n=1 Tax=Solitalea koreensis TaxID=543615 RepID=A0A521BCU6_9SPHI|nr:ABC transporter permease [Solitalea koreensis]SMO44925.1 putative ABC transport system permease protein [Solitalea koreensis]
MNFYLTAFLLGLSLSVIAMGIFISMKIFNIPDITTDGSYTLGAVITAICLSHGYPLWLTYLLAVFGGALAGSITGFIHTKLKINALLAGILVMTALYSVNLSLLGRSNLPLLNVRNIFQSLSFISDIDRNTFFILLVITTLLWVGLSLMLKTDFGLAMRATGNSESMIKALGVDTDRMKIIGLAISNGLVATSGFLVAQYQGFADINMGIGIVIVGLGSVMIGEAISHWFNISSIWINILLVIAGSIAFQVVLAFTLSLGIDANLLKLITALFVLFIVSLPNLSFRKN